MQPMVPSGIVRFGLTTSPLKSSTPRKLVIVKAMPAVATAEKTEPLPCEKKP